MMRYTIGIDNGGTLIKAGLYDADGTRLGLARTPSVTRARPGGRVEIDLDHLWQANAACVRQLLAQTGADPAQVACLGFAGQGKGLYLLGSGGQAIRAAITSADDRARDYAARWAADGTAREVTARTCQGLFSSHPVTLLAWLKDHEPETFERIRWVLSMKDYLVFRATGQVISDFSNQSGNSFVSLETRDYDPEILRLLGIPEIEGKLPPMLQATDICGGLTEAAAADLDCAPGTDVITGMFDVNASAIASGLTDDTAICIITGTAGVNVYASRAPVRDGSVAMNSLYCVPGYYLVEEGSNSSVGLLDWVISCLYADIAAKLDGGARYDELDRVAAAVSPAESEAVFLPYLYGDGETGASRGVWLGMSAADSRAHLLRAAYEGIAFAHRRLIDRLLASGAKPAAMKLAGGGARSPFFTQLLADVLQAPVEVMAGDELGVTGVNMAAGVAAGRYADFADAVARLAPVSATVIPDPARRGDYERKYGRFLAAAERLNGLT